MEQLPNSLQRIDDVLWQVEEERDNLRISYRVKDILFAKKSPFQHVMVLDTHDFGPTLVLDGIVQTTSLDGYIYNEMIAHVPLTMHPNPENVLIIGGGDCGVAREAAKYESVKRIDMVEIDELVVEASKTYIPEVSGNLDDPRVKYIYDDGIQFAKQAVNEYDVIIVDSSDPVGPAIPLFELDFYRDVHKALKDDGMMVCQSQSPIFHPDVMKNSYDRIGSLFPHRKLYTTIVPTYPGGFWSFTLGSKRPLPDLADIVFDKETRFCNADVIRASFALPEFLKAILEKQK